MLGFYDDGRFDYGCSVDHVIFEYDESVRGMAGGSEDARRRFEITLENAEAFLRHSQHMSSHFTPLGVIQGWSPGSMAEAARRLVAMGYDYLALGGTVPLKSPQIRNALQAIRDSIPVDTRLHILGFAKAEEIESFVNSGITSYDSTSPLIRAFKDARANYYVRKPGGGLEYYTAIRVPQALENPKLMRLVKEGAIRQDELVKLENASLSALRAYDRGQASLRETVEAVVAYSVPATLGKRVDDLPGSRNVATLEASVTRTLYDKPWKSCSCAICRSASIEVMIFRGSNRNKRRGMHNLKVYHDLVSSVRGVNPFPYNDPSHQSEGGHDEDAEIHRNHRQPEHPTHGGLIRCESV
jgi:hypothetical protein